MKNRFILFQRSGVYYVEDTTTGKQAIPPTRAPSIVAISQPTCCPLVVILNL